MWRIFFLDISFIYLFLIKSTYISYAFDKEWEGLQCHKIQACMQSHHKSANAWISKKGTFKTLYQWLVERFNGTLKQVLKRFCTNGFTIIRQNQSHTFLKTWLFLREWLWIVNSRWGQQCGSIKKGNKQLC